jgi:hypothetical protein
MDRREFIRAALAVGLGGGAGLLAPLAQAAPPAGAHRRPEYGHAFSDYLKPFDGDLGDDANWFCFSRFKFKMRPMGGDEWDINPFCDEEMLKYVAANTSVPLSKRSWGQRVVTVEDLKEAYDHPGRDDRFFHFPFLFITGDGTFTLEDAEKDIFREFFKRGGFLYSDDCVAQDRCYFYDSSVAAMENLFPGQVSEVPANHEIYHCCFEIPGGTSPYCQGTKKPDMGVFLDGRLVAFMTSADVHCGWWGPYFWGNLARWANGNPARMGEIAHQMGANIIVYALTH